MTYNYASGLNSDISRLTSITDSSGTLESYDYLGMGTVVRRGHSQPGVDLTYIGTGTGAGGVKYVGLDSFGRVVDQNWSKSGTATDEFSYTYDRDGNRLTKGNSVNTAFNETYTYDNLNQLSTFNRGSGTHTQSWDYDALGNWDSVTTDAATQTRTANKQNEFTSVSGATTPTYDANGNMTKDETGKQYVYDAWNRIKIVKDSGGTTLKTYSYDGLNRRVSETASGTTTDLYYSAGWQVLEEAVSGTTKSRYVWSPVYVDAMILRDRDADGNSGNGLEERLWVQQDANFNVTALVNGSGTVVERYAYDSFGKVTTMNASWTTLSVPGQIVIAFVAEFTLHCFRCMVGPFPELLRILEKRCAATRLSELALLVEEGHGGDVVHALLPGASLDGVDGTEDAHLQIDRGLLHGLSSFAEWANGD